MKEITKQQLLSQGFSSQRIGNFLQQGIFIEQENGTLQIPDHFVNCAQKRKMSNTTQKTVQKEVYDRAKEYLKHRDWSNALLTLLTFRDRNRDLEDPQLFFLIGKTYYYMNAFDEAKEEFRKTLCLAPKKKETYVYLGNIASFEKDYKEAEKHYQTYNEIDQNHSIDASIGLFRILVQQKKNKEARAVFLQVWERTPAFHWQQKKKFYQCCRESSNGSFVRQIIEDRKAEIEKEQNQLILDSEEISKRLLERLEKKRREAKIDRLIPRCEDGSIEEQRLSDLLRISLYAHPEWLDSLIEFQTCIQEAHTPSNEIESRINTLTLYGPAYFSFSLHIADFYYRAHDEENCREIYQLVATNPYPEVDLKRQIRAFKKVLYAPKQNK